MKINWFSPLPPARTDIAHYTARVLPALCERAEATLWTDQKEWDKELEKFARVRRFHGADINWTEFNRADITFYHIGNNPLFHGDIWRLSQRAPGVIVLHDIRLHHFFDGLYREQNHDRAGYFALMERYYGAESLPDAQLCYDSDARNINEMAELYPLTPLACAGALGALTHTREAFQLLQKDAKQPLAYAPLPFATPPTLNKKRANTPPYRLIVFGYLGRNRRLREILQALAGLPEKSRFRLDIYGEVTDNAELMADISRLKLRSFAAIHGFVPEAELDAALHNAHLAFNLRYPTMGEASGSQLRIWAHGLPAMVTQVGWYAALDAETVAFVRPEREVEDIQAHLRDFLAAPERFAAMGARGRQILETAHAPEIYAASVLEIAAQAKAWRGKTWAYELTERAAALTAPWQIAETSAGLAKLVSETALLAGWRKPGDREIYGEVSALSQTSRALAKPPAPTWRDKLQDKLDEWLLGARHE